MNKNEKKSKPIQIRVGPSVDYCVICGERVPEGYDICPLCRDKHSK